MTKSKLPLIEELDLLKDMYPELQIDSEVDDTKCITGSLLSVSYTHLDVYKRQVMW